MNYDIKCPVCDTKDYIDIVELQKYPISNLGLSNTKKQSLEADVFDMNICICQNCTHIYNRIPVRLDYQQNNTTYFTNAIQKKYIKEFTADFMNKYKVQNQKILEIGSGDTLFLKEISQASNDCVGYEPSFTRDFKEGGVIIMSRYFNPLHDINDNFDWIVLRHILEHFDTPYIFLKDIINHLITKGFNSKFLIEVPNIQPSLDGLRVNDFIHEHISHFSIYSLKYLLQRLNLNIIEMFTTQENENIVAICEMDKDYLNIYHKSKLYKDNFEHIIVKLQEDFNRIRTENNTIVIWGAEGRGAGFIKIVKELFYGDEYIIDSDKSKFGKFIPAIGLQISSYKNLIDKKIDSIIITTALGKDNILQEIKENNIDVKNIYCLSQFGLNLI